MSSGGVQPNCDCALAEVLPSQFFCMMQAYLLMLVVIALVRAQADAALEALAE